MLAKTHTLTETITKTLGPVFYANPDYQTILDAMTLVMARVIQSTPNKGKEQAILNHVKENLTVALKQYIEIEERQNQTQKEVVAEGVDGFAGFAKPSEAEENVVDFKKEQD